ncbi:MAG: hypothetical protein V7K48_28675 [Nostoc sp.]|uniref:hypothetical protein n=1 Tax=Nostoc sp. TaxID=1180 RepID=UPI002FFB8199
MTEGLHIHSQHLSTTSGQSLFESRPFTVQAKKASRPIPDLNTLFTRAEKYGHHLNRTHSSSISGITAVQPKLHVKQPVQLMSKNKTLPKKQKPPEEERRMQGDHVFNDFIGDTQDIIGGNLPFHSGMGIESEYRKQKVEYSENGLDNAATYGNSKRSADDALKTLTKKQVKPGAKKHPDYQNAMQALNNMQESAIDQGAYDQTKSNEVVKQTNQYRQGLPTMNDRLIDQHILSEQYKQEKIEEEIKAQNRAKK